MRDYKNPWITQNNCSLGHRVENNEIACTLRENFLGRHIYVHP